MLTDITGVRTDAFKQVLALKKRQAKPTIEKLNIVFKDYYHIIEQLGEMIDALEK